MKQRKERAPPPRNIVIGNKRTSVRLERNMWEALSQIAEAQGRTVHDIFAEIYQKRGQATLTAATRVYILEFYRDRTRDLSAVPLRDKVRRWGNFGTIDDDEAYAITMNVIAKKRAQILLELTQTEKRIDRLRSELANLEIVLSILGSEPEAKALVSLNDSPE